MSDPELGPQQTQPLSSSTISTSPAESIDVRLSVCASTFTAATSFTRTAILRPARFLRRWVSAVVFPAPKKPPRSVVGGGGVETSAAAAPQIDSQTSEASIVVMTERSCDGGRLTRGAPPHQPHGPAPKIYAIRAATGTTL